MTFLQKKLWLAWRKFRFLRLPIEKRVRLEVELDGRHLTFLLTALGEAGYGLHVVNSPWVFRELICLRKSVPMPFVIGGKERDCGLSISDRKEFSFQSSVFSQDSDRHSPLATRHSPHVLLDYDYFSGLNKGWVSHGGTANTEVGEDRGKNESSEKFNQGLHEYTRIEAEQAGLRPGPRAGASESDSLPSKLADSPVSESPIRSADGPASTPATSHPPLATALRAPYFMHPSVYHRGLHKSQLADRSKHVPCSATVQALDFGHTPPVTSYPPQRCRRFRIGFFGTHDREFYTRHYHFPGMNRFEILEIFLKKFGDRMTTLRDGPSDWNPCEIAVSIDGRGGDRQGKSFLPQEHYFAALRDCDFVLSPPGWCMPVSHNLVEAMFCGGIPITNAEAFMAPPLENGKNCLEFSVETELVAALEKALAISEQEIEKMRGAIWNYNDRFLNPKAFGEMLGKIGSDRLLVNAEENSVPLGRGL